MSAMTKKNEKVLSVRMPKELWSFLRQKAFLQERSLNQTIIMELQRVQKEFKNGVDKK